MHWKKPDALDSASVLLALTTEASNAQTGHRMQTVPFPSRMSIPIEYFSEKTSTRAVRFGTLHSSPLGELVSWRPRYTYSFGSIWILQEGTVRFRELTKP